jgi:hypothetical protein
VSDFALHIDLAQCTNNPFDQQGNKQICGYWNPELGAIRSLSCSVGLSAGKKNSKEMQMKIDSSYYDDDAPLSTPAERLALLSVIVGMMGLAVWLYVFC